MPGMPGQVTGILPPPLQSISPTTHTLAGERKICRGDSGLKRSCRSGVSRLSPPPYGHKGTNSRVLRRAGLASGGGGREPRGFAERPHSSSAERERGMTAVQRDRINRWTNRRLGLPADVVRSKTGVSALKCSHTVGQRLHAKKERTSNLPLKVEFESKLSPKMKFIHRVGEIMSYL